MDIQLWLDGMLPPTEKFNMAIKANNQLSDAEKNCLKQMAEDSQKQGARYNVDAALTTIASSFGKYFNQGKEPPFLLKQVIFCLAVHCLRYEKKSQKDVLNHLNKNKTGTSLTHNFFTRLGHTPAKYLTMCKYKIPKTVVGYMGQKRAELGVAIKNLVYQAGDYGLFCDVFGGSGAASLAVNKVNEATYIYNELNIVVFNLFSVIADDVLYLELIDSLKKLQEYIYEGGEQLGDADLDKATKDYFKKTEKVNSDDVEILKKGYTEFQINGYETNKLMYEVYDNILDQPKEFTMKAEDGTTYTRQELLDLFEIPKYLKQMHDNISNQRDKFTRKSKDGTTYTGTDLLNIEEMGEYTEERYKYILNQPDEFTRESKDGRKYTRKQLLDLFQIWNDIFTQIERMRIMATFLSNSTLLFYYARKYLSLNLANFPKYVPVLDEEDDEDEAHVSNKNKLYTGNLDVTQLISAYRQIRSYTYFTYFKKLWDSDSIPQDKRVLFAVAEIFRHYFATMSMAEEKSVLSTLRRSYPISNKSKHKIESFIKVDFKERITKMHDAIRGTVCLNGDFSFALERIKGIHSSIYYADPPYASTKGYEAKNKVNEFTEEDMEKLIRDLVESGSKFIYSCRAVKNSKNITDANEITKKSNQLIIKTSELIAEAGRKTEEANQMQKKAEDMRKSNKDKIAEDNNRIFRSVFAVFAEYIELGKITDFYVLAIKNPRSNAPKSVKAEEDAYSLPWSIRHNQVMELMITNFEICSFADESYPKIDYTVYKFTDFLKLLLKYANANLNIITTPEDAAIANSVMKSL